MRPHPLWKMDRAAAGLLSWVLCTSCQWLQCEVTLLTDTECSGDHNVPLCLSELYGNHVYMVDVVNSELYINVQHAMHVYRVGITATIFLD